MPQGKGTYGSQVGRPRENYMTAGPIVSTEPSYKEKMSSFLDGLQDFFINDERRAERQMYTSGRRQERRENRQERRNIRQAKRAGRRDLETIDASGPRRMEQPQFKQDRQAIFDENVQALQEKASRKANATGGEMKREQYEEGGEMDDQMNALAISVSPAKVEEVPEEEQEMLPDEEMEEDYVDYVMQQTLSNEDRNYLISALEKDDRLSEIFDQVVESATEFSGSGPIEGPGSEMSDSIPARLSDGEFVFTAKAVEEIGVDNLQQMMEDAETIADERQGVAYGGMVEEEGDPKAVPIQTTGSQTAQRNVPNVVKPNRQVEEEMLKASPRRYYVPISG
tara:strand:+ start:1457 stop:2470 length:1014 start_codon:yes stop_codon:yes gene_type:complete